VPLENVLRAAEAEVERAREQGRREAEASFVGAGAVAIALSGLAAASEDMAQRLRSSSPTIAAFLEKQAGLYREVSTPPRVISTKPAADAANVPATAAVQAVFENRVEAQSLNAEDGGFSIAPASGGAALQATVDFDSNSKTALLRPENGLTPGVQYKARIGKAVTNRGGIEMEPFEWSFTVAEAEG
jgi:hypothetical protein